MKKIFLAIGLMVLTLSVMAGEKGNGGDAVVCPDNIMLLDRYEGIKKGYDLALPEGSFETKINFVTEKLKKIDESKVSDFVSYTNDLLQDIKARANGGELTHTTFVTDELRDVDDSEELAIPHGCSKEQLVIRRDPSEIRPYDVYTTEYVINELLWDRLDEAGQAMTIIHEALYKITTHMGHSDSRLARHLNTLLSSSRTLSFVEYFKLLEEGDIFSLSFPATLEEHSCLVSALGDNLENKISVRKHMHNTQRLYFGNFDLEANVLHLHCENIMIQLDVFYNENGQIISGQAQKRSYEVEKFKNGSIDFNGVFTRNYDGTGTVNSIESQNFDYIVKDGVKTDVKGKKVKVFIQNGQIASFQIIY